VRERMLLWGAAAGGAVLVFVIGLGIYFGYSWYQRRYGPTAERAIETYFGSLADGDYATMYEMTADSDLMVLGRKISESEFADRTEELLGGQDLELNQIETEKSAQRGEYHYFAVTLHYELGLTGKVTRLLVELRHTGENWKVTYPFTPSL
jgi:hypothetical protein